MRTSAQQYLSSVVRRALRPIARRRRRTLDRRLSADVHAILRGTTLGLLDVGAAGGILPRWAPYRRDIAFTAVEPDERASAELVASAEATDFAAYRVIPTGAWARDGALHVSLTRKPMCSSHYLPNMPLLARYGDAARYDIVSQTVVDCRKIDHLLANDLAATDFIKLDLEGGELEVLRGASTVLQSCLGLHVEVSFRRLRHSQPLFGDVSAYLAERDFEFIDFLHINRWERGVYRNTGQAMVADALYLRSPENVSELLATTPLAPEKGRAYLAILLIYERYDLAERFLALTGRQYADARPIVVERQRAFARRVRVADALSAVLSHWEAPNASCHLLY